MYLLGGFEGMLIRGECWEMAQFEAYFDTIFPSENSIYLPLLQWRSEGNWRPGAKLSFAPPPPQKYSLK